MSERLRNGENTSGKRFTEKRGEEKMLTEKRGGLGEMNMVSRRNETIWEKSLGEMGKSFRTPEENKRVREEKRNSGRKENGLRSEKEGNKSHVIVPIVL